MDIQLTPQVDHHATKLFSFDLPTFLPKEDFLFSNTFLTQSVNQLMTF